MFRRFVASLLILSLITPFSANAGMVATEEVLHRDRIVSVLDRADVQARLQAYGVTPAEVKARIAALTHGEAAELAARMDSLPAGGVDILSAILVVFLVLLITDILGFTKVFPFTRPMR
jgi:pyruvate/oxaloacetate carboxyltransferase